VTNFQSARARDGYVSSSRWRGGRFPERRDAGILDDTVVKAVGQVEGCGSEPAPSVQFNPGTEKAPSISP